jgi:ABC-type uncharacterized transport system substrate-binding protein
MVRFKITIFVLLFYIVPTTVEAKENQVIEVLVTSDNSIYEQGLYGIQSVLKSEIKITYLDILTDEQPDLALYFRELESTGVPLFIAIGPAAAKVAKENLKRTPLIFSMVNSPKSLALETGDICGVSMDISVGEFFQTLKDINPDAKSVYSFYSSPEGEHSASEGEYNDLKYKLYYHKMKVNTQNDINSYLDEIKGKADAFYMVNDPLYGKDQFEKLSEFAKNNKIILMTSFTTLVKIGATFGISPDYSKLGVLTGQMAERILSGESSCQKERVLLPDQSSFYLNEDYANSSGIIIPEAIIARAKLTNLFTIGISKLNEGKLKSAKIIFDSILKKDPKNLAASTYRELILEKLTGTETKKLLISAEKNFKEGLFTQSRADYQRILNLNPNLLVAKQGYEQSLIGQSEQERYSGSNFAKNGKYFEAIKMYLASLRTWPSNSKATADLASTRNHEIAKVPNFVDEGIKSYNNRDYELSIKNFENVLLVDPGNKEASEYLRLSYKKQEAIKVLKGKIGK